jgi:hypothetical protein
MHTQHHAARTIASAGTGLLLLLAAMPGIWAQQGQAPQACRIAGKITSGSIALPGVAVTILDGDRTVTASSSDIDGTWRVSIPPAGNYQLRVELTGFQPLTQDLAGGVLPCDRAMDLQLTLAPRATTPVRPPQGAPAPAGAAAAASRFETLAVQSQAPAEVVAGGEREGDAAARLLLPPGFSTEGPTEAVAINGNMANVDRGMMMERLEAISRGEINEAIGRGEFSPATGEFAQGFGPGAGADGFGGGRGGRGGPGGPDGPGGRGGPGGPGAFQLAGRGGRQNAYNAQANYTFGGSALDAEPYQLRPDAPVNRQPYTRQNFGVTAGGPVRIPGVYDGQRRTTFMVNYGGNRGDNLFDQYATVPSVAMRGGDFSATGVTIVDPLTGQPFPGNVIPAARLDPTSLALLRFIPSPNGPGDTPNFHRTDSTESSSDNLNVRVTHNFTPAAGGRGGGGRGGPGGGRGGRGGPGGRGNQATSVVLNAQVQYRSNSGEQNNVYPELGGSTNGSSLSTPVSLNITHRRQLHNVNFNYSRTSSDSLNQYAFVENVAGDAGIVGIATDPFDWGVPALSFSSFTGVRDVAPSRRDDRRLTVGYTWTRPSNRHTLRLGGDFRWDRAENQTDTNANGAYVFTGFYSSGGVQSAQGTGVDFADFLLGVPQQASLQYGPGNVQLTGRSMSVFVQDDWRPASTVTVNAGLRYELLWPFVEQNGHMVNLDAAPDFTAVSPVVSGGFGPYSGAFPSSLVTTDWNNLAPRVGLAWRFKPGNILRGGYGVSFNSGTYSTIARQLVGQPPFAVTNTSLGTRDTPLSITRPFDSAVPAETTNNYGIEKDYRLGVVQTLNADVSRELRQVWSVGAGYTHTRGSSLDMVRAPNRGPNGLRIEGVQPFLWQSSEASSTLHAARFRLMRRPVRGLGGGITYTLARSRDNASSIGGGTVVAQDDQNLDAEWGLSSFDRRHQLSVDSSVELPFGPNKRWLQNGGPWASILSNWRATAAFTWQSGTPYTARVNAAAADVARGTNGTLRADYNGQTIGLSDPTIDRFFNVDAFSIPAPGTFGNSSRNIIIGPGSRLLNAQLSRDMRLGGTRVVSFQWNANNLLNLVNYATIDTNVNSPTFGQILSVRPMRTMQFNLRFRY